MPWIDTTVNALSLSLSHFPFSSHQSPVMATKAAPPPGNEMMRTTDSNKKDIRILNIESAKVGIGLDRPALARSLSQRPDSHSLSLSLSHSRRSRTLYARRSARGAWTRW
jgi:hypothetical protein